MDKDRERSISSGEDISDSTVITGDHNTVIDTAGGDNITGRLISTERYIETQFDIGLFSANLSGAINIIRKLLPDEKENVLQSLSDALCQLRLQQKKVNELKQVHNMLHHLEIYFNIMQISPNADFANLRQVRETWRATARPQLTTLAYFAETEMKYLEEPLFCETESSLNGPRWVLDLWILKADLENSFQDGTVVEVADLIMAMLDSCREHLFVIDSQLLNAITQLDKYSDAILRVLDND